MRAGICQLIAGALALCAAAAEAQPGPKRLSDWLLEQRIPNSYPLGLSWRVPEERAAQEANLQRLLEDLGDSRTVPDAQAARRLREWIEGLPATGRVPVALADARWLQANPERDPIVMPDHRVVLPTRPRTVTVITGSGELCQVVHSSGLKSLDYLRTCTREGPGIDWVWIAQPDGQIHRFGAAQWNWEPQDEPAPGAWVWGPSRGAGWPEGLSEALMRFLATQGPSEDAHGAPLQPPARAGATPRSINLATTASDWGGIGLLQTPTARMNAPGHFSFSLSRVRPYTNGNIIAQPLDWMEAGFRYTNVANIPYAPGLDQGYKDKSFDVKFRVWPESAYVPEIAIGARDVSGTGLFSGEYAVASKRTGNFDWSLGLGWGYVGARGNVRNPLGRLFSRYDQRSSGATAQGGNFSLGSFFSGPAAVFGGVQYQTPWSRLQLKLEYDGNDYRHEPLANNQVQRTPFNFGVVYRATNWADLTFGVERGDALVVGLNMHHQLNELFTTKVSDPPRVPLVFDRPKHTPDWSTTAREISRQTRWSVGAIEQRGSDLIVTFDDSSAAYWRDPIERIALVLHRDAPSAVDRFILRHRQNGIDLVEHVIDRNAWLFPKATLSPPGERRPSLVIRPPANQNSGDTVHTSGASRFDANLTLDYRQTLGSPDAFVLYQIGAVGRLKFRFREDTWLQGAVWLALTDNYWKFNTTGDSDLPRVRTFLREYLTTSRVQLANLQLSHVGKVTPNQYYSVYGGYLEEMFAGIGGEWLYRKFGSGTAFGVDINAVQQRTFEQRYRLRDYRTVTGHGTLYWDTGWQDVKATLSFGKYLAGDIGGTIDLSRTFQNGMTFGVFATRTNVSAAQFGEGSFDKGVYVSVPFDAMLTRSSSVIASFLWRPLTRDGGVKLARQVQLYPLTSLADDRTLWYKPAPQANEAVIPAERRESWQPTPQGPTPYLRALTRAPAQAWTSREDFSYRLTEALYAQEFRNIRINFDANYRLNLAVSNKEIQPISRAVGRAARTALRLAPLETREIRITFSDGTEPLVTYEFTDAIKLQRYLDGLMPQKEFAETVAVHYIDPGAKQADPLARLNDLSTEQEPKTLLSIVTEPPRQATRVIDDFKHVGRKALDINWMNAALVTASAVVSSSFLDKRAHRFAEDHKDNRWLKAGVSAGDLLPWMGLGASALIAMDGSDPNRSRAAYAATEAGATAFLAATGLKYVIGRARPGSGLGPREFQVGATDDAHQSFPSRHTTVAWAVATPYAKEYNAPWIYGVAALTNLARIGSREHWVSDTVGSALLGYGLGELFWQSSRERSAYAPRVSLSPSGIDMAWKF